MKKTEHEVRTPRQMVGDALGTAFIVLVVAAAVIGFVVWAASDSSDGWHRALQETGWQAPDCDQC